MREEDEKLLEYARKISEIATKILDSTSRDPYRRRARRIRQCSGEIISIISCQHDSACDWSS